MNEASSGSDDDGGNYFSSFQWQQSNSNNNNKKRQHQQQQQQAKMMMNQQKPQSAANNNNSSNSSKKREIVVKSALCIIPPQHVWDPIQTIRKEHDKAYPRWMPHINILYPFYNDSCFDEIAAELNTALADFHAFKLTFEMFDFFTHKSSSTLWLRPDDAAQTAMEALFVKLAALYPDCASNKESGEHFTAHLSVGQWGNREIRDVQLKYNEKWQPITVDINKIYLISRQGFDDPFQVRHEINLMMNKKNHENVDDIALRDNSLQHLF